MSNQNWRMHILLVEDNVEKGRSLERLLKHAQFAVTFVTNATKAIEKVEINEYDLILLDFVLPDDDAIKVCTSVRALGIRIPILVMSSRSDIESRVAALDSGADDLITKPFSYDELLARLRALFRREPSLRADTLTIGGVELDSTRYMVRSNGTHIQLTNKEYRLLNFLMRRPNQLCTKSMLEEHVWGHFYLRNSNVIEVTMSRLRKKIEGAGSFDFIKTRRGIGYVVVDT